MIIDKDIIIISSSGNTKLGQNVSRIGYYIFKDQITLRGDSVNKHYSLEKVERID